MSDMNSTVQQLTSTPLLPKWGELFRVQGMLLPSTTSLVAFISLYKVWEKKTNNAALRKDCLTFIFYAVGLLPTILAITIVRPPQDAHILIGFSVMVQAYYTYSLTMEMYKDMYPEKAAKPPSGK